MGCSWGERNGYNHGYEPQHFGIYPLKESGFVQVQLNILPTKREMYPRCSDHHKKRTSTSCNIYTIPKITKKTRENKHQHTFWRCPGPAKTIFMACPRWTICIYMSHPNKNPGALFKNPGASASSSWLSSSSLSALLDSSAVPGAKIGATEAGSWEPRQGWQARKNPTQHQHTHTHTHASYVYIYIYTLYDT